MRNDHRDDFDDVPSLRADARDRDFVNEPYEPPREQPYAPAAVAVKAPSTGPLWALIGALLIGLGGLGWWSFQQIRLMEQQLVATQESFARISEEAAGRIQDISGKVVATESTVTSGSEALKLEVRQLERKLVEMGRLLQGSATAQSDSAKRVEQLSTDLKARQAENEKLAAQLSKVDSAQSTLITEQGALKSEQASLKTALAGQGKVEEKIVALRTEVDALKKQGNPNQAVARIEQDLLVLKSELENRPASPASGTASTTEFDAFRAQMTRNINTLQAQVQNLQKQIDAR